MRFAFYSAAHQSTANIQIRYTPKFKNANKNAKFRIFSLHYIQFVDASLSEVLFTPTFSDITEQVFNNLICQSVPLKKELMTWLILHSSILGCVMCT